MTTHQDDDDDPVDKAALTRAMNIAMADPRYRDQLLSKAMHQPWREVAEFAASCCQIDAMHLSPWERPPCHGYLLEVNGTTFCDPKAGKWYDRLAAANLSIYEPNPPAALAAAKAR